MQADLVGADKRWCEVNHVTYESVKQPGVHVIGDATTGLPVPKSGNVANAMGKISRARGGEPASTASSRRRCAPGNTCYSWVSDREAIAVVNAYKIDNGKVVQIEQKLTPGRARCGPARGGLGRVHLGGRARMKARRRATTRKVTWLALAASALLGALTWSGSAAAGPLDERGAVKAITCAACHGAAGNSRSSAMPIIAGLDAAYFRKQIEDYAAGRRSRPRWSPTPSRRATWAWTTSRPTSPRAGARPRR